MLIMTPIRRRGFTLIELLVVIGIIAVLIGILLPVLGKVRASGKAAVCMANMRQMALATNGYMTDNNQYLPQPSRDGAISTDPDKAVWYNALDYYVGNSNKSGTSGDRNDNAYKQDPVWNDLPVTVNGSTTLEQDSVRTIKMNEFFGHISSATNPVATGSPAFKFFRVTRIPLPGKTVLYGDGRAHDTPAVNTGAVDVGGTNLFSMREATVGLRHEDGANLVKVDTSVSHEINPIKTGTGTNQYRGWYDNDDSVVENRPDAIFNFRPEDFVSP